MPEDDRLKGQRTAKNIQAHALQKLLKDPSKPVVIPEMGSDKKTLRPAREMIANVQGSTAAAGSGEFHVYKEARRREYERLALMDQEDKEARAREEAIKRQKEYEAAAEAKTAKNRAKRMKRKQKLKSADKKQSSTNADGQEDAHSSSDEDGRAQETNAIKKRKIGASGAVPMGSNDQTEQTDSLQEELPSEQERLAVAKEAGISIRDED